MPVLFSAICPHQHNIVSEFHDTVWKCPSHDWTFEPNTGRSINAPQECLTKFLVEEINESLFVTFPDKIKTKIKQIPGPKIPPKISVVGNAMRTQSGIAKTMFETLANNQINIHVISTSEIKISVLISSDYYELAMRSLHSAFGLDA